MKFEELAKYLERLESTASRNEMTVILAELFRKASPEDGRLIAYLSSGRLGPAYKSPDFGVADKMMIKALSQGSKKDTAELFRKVGDLGLVAQEITSHEHSNLSVEEVFSRLLEIANASGSGSQEKKQTLIAALLEESDKVSARYITRIVLSKLRTGFSDMTVLDSLSWMIEGTKKLRPKIESMYNVRADLGEIVAMVKSNNGPVAVVPELGTPILMARAERAIDSTDIWERNGRCAVEYKLDGLRIQAHVQKNKVTLFSRGLEDVSPMFPDVISGLRAQITKDCIVEGEMIALGSSGKFLPFQETMQRKRKYDISEMALKIPLCIYLFDVLWIDGKDVMHQPNQNRRELLEKLVSPGKTVKHMDRKIVDSSQAIDEFYNLAIAAGTEGIIAKKLDGVYQAGARDFNWIKYKKSYHKSALADTLDVVVMGYDVGQGKRSGFGIGDFLAGVYDSKTDKYLTVAKIGTGLTDEEWKHMKTLLSSKASISKEKPGNYEVSKSMKCDYWVTPQIVVEILADEITKSPMHSSGYALRFPRLVSWREKKPQDATSVSELLSMYQLQSQK